VNRSNKELYWPQIALVLVKMVFVAGAGIWVHTWLGGDRFLNFLQMGSLQDFFSMVLGAAGISMLGLILWLLMARMVEAGLYYMYKTAVLTGTIQSGTFGTGVAKYFLSFLLGDLLISAALLVLFIPWVIIGIITVSIGFTVGIIGVGVLLMFWKVSLVWKEEGVIAAIKDSILFAWNNLLALVVLFLIRGSFSSPMNFSASGGNFSNVINYRFDGSDTFFNIDPVELSNYLRLGVAIATPLLVIIIAGAALVRMIFDVFFGLTLFITYKHGFSKEEVAPDVV